MIAAIADISAAFSPYGLVKVTPSAANFALWASASSGNFLSRSFSSEAEPLSAFFSSRIFTLAFTVTTTPDKIRAAPTSWE